MMVTPAGGKLWRLRFRVGGKEKTLSLGAYPKLGLSEARRLKSEALDKLDQGIDPAAEKRRQKFVAAQIEVLTFQHVAKQ
jgi:hypothetical protein